LPNWERALQAKPSRVMPEQSQGPARLGDPQALPSQTSAQLGRAKLTSSLAWLGLLPSLIKRF